jgi:hypothetical protein
MPIICYDITTPTGEGTAGEYELDSRDARALGARKTYLVKRG